MKIKSVIILLIICSLVYFSCSGDIPDLSEYQGVNYLKSSGLNAPDWDINLKAKSDFTVAGFDYMIFDKNPSPSNMVYTGLPGNTDSGDISRLEVPNLAPNGGFEETGGSFSLPTGWTKSSIAVIKSNSQIESVHSITTPVNNSLFLEFPDELDFLSFNLLATNAISDSFFPATRYTLRFNFKKSKPSRMHLKFDGKSWTPVIQTEWTETKYETFHESIIKGTDNNFYFLHQEGDIASGFFSCIDDFQVIRNEIDYYINNFVPFKSDIRPVLYSGVYRFSVFLKAEDNDDINTVPSSASYPNNFRVRTSTVILEIKDKRKTAVSIFKYKTDHKGEETSETAFTKNRWTELYVDKFIQIDNEDDIIELRIYPVDPTGSHNTLEAGSVLIANPKLYYISE
jgi:hypothetical protein